MGATRTRETYDVPPTAPIGEVEACRISTCKIAATPRRLRRGEDARGEPGCDDFEFWVGRNGADNVAVRLGGSGQRYWTVASSAVRSGGGLERTVLVELAPEGGIKPADIKPADSNEIDID